MSIRKEILDELLQNYKRPEDLIGDDGILKELSKALIERTMAGELTYHLGYEKHESRSEGVENARNGTTLKRVKTKHGEMELEIPRDRESTFEPVLIKK